MADRVGQYSMGLYQLEMLGARRKNKCLTANLFPNLCSPNSQIFEIFSIHLVAGEPGGGCRVLRDRMRSGNKKGGLD